MKNELQRYVSSLSEFRANTRNNRWLVVHFSYFLTELQGESISPKNLRKCFEALSLSAPGNISDVISKSRAFVKTREGLKLHHDILVDIAAKLTAKSQSGEVVESNRFSDKVHNVVVVYGRDEAVRNSIFQFLRALKLNPIEWSEAVRATGHGSPYVGQVLDSLFALAQAIVVLFTPDESAQLKDVLRSPEDDETLNQPRPNVLIESGMALAKDEAHTILVQVGRIRAISDLSGRHVIRLSNSAQKRVELAQRLETAGCQVSMTGTDWLSVGDFSAS